MGFKQICIYIYNYMNKNIELFKISTYNLKRVNYVKTIFTENEIKNELIYDKSYHIQYFYSYNYIYIYTYLFKPHLYKMAFKEKIIKLNLN